MLKGGKMERKGRGHGASFEKRVGGVCSLPPHKAVVPWRPFFGVFRPTGRVEVHGAKVQ